MNYEAKLNDLQKYVNRYKVLEQGGASSSEKGKFILETREKLKKGMIGVFYVKCGFTETSARNWMKINLRSTRGFDLY